MDPQWSALAEGEPATDGPTGSTGRTGSDTRMRGIRRRNHFKKVAEDVLHEGDSKLQKSYNISYNIYLVYFTDSMYIFQRKSPVKMRPVEWPTVMHLAFEFSKGIDMGRHRIFHIFIC